MALNLIQWYITDSAKYAALTPKDDNALYFLTDTKEIYRGAVSFSEAVVFYTDTRPATGAQGKIYVDSTTLAGSVYTGTGWTDVILPVSQTIDNDNPTTNPVSGAAVKDYVTGRISAVNGDFVTGLTWDSTKKALVFVKDGTNTDVKLTTMVTAASYDGASGKVSFTDVDGTEVSSFNIPLDNFVKSGSYDETKGALVLEMQNGTTVEIPATDLVDIYTAGTTKSVTVAIDSANGNAIKADVNISAEAGNGLIIKDDGLFAQATDISGKLDLVATAKAGEIVIAKADGQVEVSGVKAGGATLAATPNSTTLATEAAVQAVKSAIESTASTTYVAQSNITTTIADAATAVDTKVASEKAVRTAVDAGVTKAVSDAKTAADQTYVAKTDVVDSEANLNATAPSATKVMSETAFVEAMSWHTLA